ncbi:hypothetical protein B0H21DRAFT_562086 [Amylocystis lapponica]|nr:hypothetical protein B0H21DRAFT_562086 [Amylocystis lapponica]
MSSGTIVQTRTTGQRGRKGSRGRGGGRGGGVGKGAGPASPQTRGDETPAVAAVVAQDTAKIADNASEADDSAVCWICAEQVKYYSVSECNHRTCHVCALRLRALYKKLECTFCKESQPSVIFTKSPDALWASYTPDLIPYKDPKLSISFETQEMMEETLILLRFNCPDPDCDYIGNGWSDLKLHTRAVHGKLMCDVCIRFKKIFAHEHALYPPNILPLHLPSMHRSHGPPRKEQIEGGVHPLCEFCRDCFFGDDELYAHMREKHEECFVCKRAEVKDQYFRNYDALEQHFTNAHYPCTQPQCLIRKFVVFGSALDLKAHMVEEHGAEMSSRDKKDARRIQAEFEFEEVGAGRRGRPNRREREPPPHIPVPSGPARTNAAGARRREAFSGNLTVEGPGARGTPNGATPNRSQLPSRRQTPSPAPEGEPAAERNSALITRINTLAPNATTAVPVIQSAIRSYRVSESAARDLISTVWNILDRNLDGTASIVNFLVDLIDGDDKKRDLLAAWNGFKIEQRAQFPELIPTAIGTEWSGVTSGRVLNVKHSTSTRSSAQSSGQLWDRVARAAASSSTPSQRPPDRFPPLQPTVSAPAAPPFRQPQRNTPWASSAVSAPPPPRGPISVPGPGTSSRVKPALALSKSAFPELPTSSAVRVPKDAVGGNQSLRRILGDTAPAAAAWRAGANGSSASAPGEEEGAQEPATVGRKKGKGKQKQTLFTLGSFPT